MTNTITASSWSRLTRWAGLGAFASYLGAAFLPLPESIGLLLAFAFGPLFMIASLGIYRLLKLWKTSIWLEIGFLFNVVATALVTLMIVVQQAGFTFHDRFKGMDRGTVTDEQLKWMFKEVNSVQLGIDITWDVFISLGTACFAVAMWRHPVFGRVLPAFGLLVSALLLGFNLAWFPEPPAEVGSIDFGPAVALWYIVLAVFLRIRGRKLDES